MYPNSLRNHPYYDHPQNLEFSPLRENYVLKVDDIPGTRPRPSYATKNTQHYYEKLPSTNNVFEANRIMHEKLYAMGNYHQGTNLYNSQKKHYGIHQESEIARTRVLQRNDGAPRNLNAVDFPRNLTTQDIPGAVPGTLQSKTVKNHDLAQKIRVSSISPVKIAEPNDMLDKFQEAYSRPSVPKRDNNIVIPPGTNNFHYTQHQEHQQNYEQSKPNPNEQFYAAPPPENRGSVNQNEQSFVEDRKNKHVVFKDEPREEYREEPQQYKEEPTPYREQQVQHREQPGQYRDQPSQKREQSNQYREQASPYRERLGQPQQQDYLDSYVSQAADHSQPGSVTNQKSNLQDYQLTPSPLVPIPRSTYTNKKEQLDRLTHDILAQQQTLERRVRETSRGRAFNIISNGPREHNRLEGGRRAYGSAIKALANNHEDLRSFDYGAPRGYTPLLETSMRQGERSGLSMQNTPEPRISVQDRGRPTMMLPPLQNGQKRNLSGMKYY